MDQSTLVAFGCGGAALLTLLRCGKQRAAKVRAGAPVVALGTQNKCKTAAVLTVLSRYPGLADSAAGLHAVKVDSGVGDQPKSLAETSKGAQNRAVAAFKATPGCNLSFGIESGLFDLDASPGSGDKRWYDVCVCAVYDGRECRLGMSCAFEIPPKIMARVDTGEDLTQACNSAGITTDANLGEAGGLIGILSKNRIDRKLYTEQALMTALMSFENKPWY